MALCPLWHFARLLDYAEMGLSPLVPLRQGGHEEPTRQYDETEQ